MKNLIAAIMLGLFFSTTMVAQESSLTKEMVLNMTIDELSELPLEDLMYAVELLEVQSVDELFSMIMNKNVSSASKKEEDSFKSPLSSSVITKEEMRMYGCTTIEEALRLMPGMIVREKTNGNFDAHLRGLDNVPDGNMFIYNDNMNTLVMINGRPVYNYALGSTLWETLPISIEDVARIEVVRGAVSALYGANAVTGVVNIITENPSQGDHQISGQVSAGTMDTYIGDISFRRAFNDKWAASLSANMQTRKRSTSDMFLMPEPWLINTRTGEAMPQGGWVSFDDFVHNIKRKDPSTGQIHEISELSAPLTSMFENPSMARRNVGINGNVVFNPKDGIAFNLMGGYQQSLSMNTPVGDDYFPLNVRQSKTGYVDLRADIKGLALQFNYSDGPQNFMVGAPSFKIRDRVFTATAEYDINIKDKLSIRPGINLRNIMFTDKPYDNYYGRTKFEDDGEVKLISFLGGKDAYVKSLAGSVRLDYKPIDQLRFIGAYRSEKLNIPDKSYSTWQIAATYSPNDKHNLRFIYSRGNRSAIITNTSANYEMMRTNLSMPDRVRFKGNEEADVMYADNYEVGYRWRPTSNLMFDLEGYHSISQDYGALMAVSSDIMVGTKRFNDMFKTCMGYLQQVQAGTLDMATAFKMLEAQSRSVVTALSYIQYNNLPYKVKQTGVSLAADWIASSKVVVKAHLNMQQTKIDNYYTYSQKADIAATLQGAVDADGNKIKKGSADLYAEMINDFVTTMAHDPVKAQWLMKALQTTTSGLAINEMTEYRKLLSAGGMETEASKEYLKQFENEDQYNIYLACKYNIRILDNAQGQKEFAIGTDRDTTPKPTVNGHKHKATPSIYGMIGVVFKPLNNLTFAANSYFYGKQTTKTTYGTEVTNPKCIVNWKIGYKPAEDFEIFFSAHNLLNGNRPEYIYMDPGKGLYSLGFNFGF